MQVTLNTANNYKISNNRKVSFKANEQNDEKMSNFEKNNIDRRKSLLIGLGAGSVVGLITYGLTSRAKVPNKLMHSLEIGSIVALAADMFCQSVSIVKRVAKNEPNQKEN